MKIFKTFFTAVLFLALVSCNTSNGKPSSPVPGGSAAAMVRGMDIGINIGNMSSALKEALANLKKN